MLEKICAMSNLTAQTGFNKSNKLIHENKLWAKMRNSVVRHYHNTQYSRIPVSHRLLDLDRLE